MSNDLFIHQISFIATTSSTISDICRVDCPLLRPPIAFLVMAQTPILDRRQLRGGREAPNVNLVRVSIFSLPLRREAEKPNAFFPSLNKQGSCSSSSPRLRMTDSFPILTPSLSHSLEGDPGTKRERGDSKSLHADFGMFLGGRGGLSSVCLSIRLVSPSSLATSHSLFCPRVSIKWGVRRPPSSSSFLPLSLRKYVS